MSYFCLNIYFRFVTKLLEDLVFFVCVVPNNGQDVLSVVTSTPNRERQKLMREQNILAQVSTTSICPLCVDRKQIDVMKFNTRVQDRLKCLELYHSSISVMFFNYHKLPLRDLFIKLCSVLSRSLASWVLRSQIRVKARC